MDSNGVVVNIFSYIFFVPLSRVLEENAKKTTTAKALKMKILFATSGINAEKCHFGIQLEDESR